MSYTDALDTGHWAGIGGLAFAAFALGLPFQRPGLFLVALVGVGFAAYARLGDAPEPDLTVEYDLSESSPAPDDEVTVSITVENTGSATLPDLRLIDGVPPGLSVTDGTARLGTALRPGKRATYSYTVTATRGTHEWEPMTAVVRNASGSRERTVEIEQGTTLRCLPELAASSDLPLRGLTTPYAGRVATDVAGSGLEFHSTREYRRGDPLSRVDWNRYARSGELSTVSFREERAATVVLLIDSREDAYRAPDDETPNAVERSVDAAGEAFSALLATGDRVGLASYGPEECWLAPSTGERHRATTRRMLADHPAFAVAPAEGPFYPSITLRRLRRRLPADAQVVLFSPAADDYIASVAERLDAYGHQLTLISPDPTVADSTPHRLARLERDARLRGLRSRGIRVIDWGERPLAVELTRATRRWGR
ncbi:DUF58 domain-containing protein [Halolamina salifodinae]|uniref:Putative repeat protein (TIGR01451 family) n=1 Tax=Halolamina salifodinae TaxID=1202767 RepID=A0A8T4GTB8_9EURY|nr:DUF58 domain-containing protein [Halolamina salifodinae]MBP1986341.1 putative repeat protein (TIGR01451 family) [Halolamina salifodinae]